MAPMHAQGMAPGTAPGAQQAPTPISTYMMGAMILTALSGILMLVDDFGGGYWNDYYNGIEGYVWLGAWTSVWGFLIIMPMALAMFYMAFWSSKAMRDPRVITVQQLQRFFIISLAIGGFMLLLGIIWAGYAIAEEYDEWWFDVAFYGGVIGGFLSAVVFHQAKQQARALGSPGLPPQAPFPRA